MSWFGDELIMEGLVLWFTGLRGSGKTTQCNALARARGEKGAIARVLDTDDLRTSLCSDLKPSIKDRSSRLSDLSRSS